MPMITENVEKYWHVYLYNKHFVVSWSFFKPDTSQQ